MRDYVSGLNNKKIVAERKLSIWFVKGDDGGGFRTHTSAHTQASLPSRRNWKDGMASVLGTSDGATDFSFKPDLPLIDSPAAAAEAAAAFTFDDI